jgi:hypothetical protein
MPEMEGKTIIGELSTDLVAKVKNIGLRTVYPLKVGGSHCYMADGICVLA